MANSKKLGSLNVDDLKANPIWRTTKSGATEKVVPTDMEAYPTDDTDSELTVEHLVYTKFTTKNGTIFFGYSFPWDSSGADYTQPTLITSKGHIALGSDKISDLGDVEKALGLAINQIFPMKIETMVRSKDGKQYADQLDPRTK